MLISLQALEAPLLGRHAFGTYLRNSWISFASASVVEGVLPVLRLSLSHLTTQARGVCLKPWTAHAISRSHRRHCAGTLAALLHLLRGSLQQSRRLRIQAQSLAALLGPALTGAAEAQAQEAVRCLRLWACRCAWGSGRLSSFQQLVLC